MPTGKLLLTRAHSVDRDASQSPGSAQHSRRGRWAVIALWWALTALAVGLFVTSLPAHFQRMATLCTTNCALWQVEPYMVPTLQRAGITLPTFATFTLATETLLALVYTVVAIITFLIRSTDRVVLLATVTLLTYGTVTFNDVITAQPPHTLLTRILITTLVLIGSASFDVFVFCFPDGRFVPGWTRWLALGWFLEQTPHALVPGTALDNRTWPAAIQLLIWALYFLSVGYAQVYRYRRVSTGQQRLQARWVVLDLMLMLAGFCVMALAEGLSGRLLTSGQGYLLAVLGAAIVVLGVLLIPVCIALAILRYRLFDIDLIINRALVYSTLTATVAVAYVASILLLHTLFSPFLGQGNALSIVVSTLLIAALIRPLRSRIQMAIDRRFYRRKYDAQRTISQFAEALRSDTDLDQIHARLIETVSEAMQPTSATLWLATPKKQR